MSTLLDDLDQLGWDEEDEAPAAKPTGPRPTGRGWSRRGGGRVSYVQAPVKYRGTTNQVNGLNPWTIGASAPLVGVPNGRIMAGRSGAGATLCMDPLNWFQPGNIISRPSAYIEAEPGIGKSALVKHQILGLAGMGVNPLVLGDLKPDYVPLLRAMGGQVVELGPGRGHLNILDNRAARRAAKRLSGDARARMLADGQSRRVTMLAALLTLLRGQAPDEREEEITTRALQILDEKLPDRSPIIADLLQVIREAPDRLREAAVDYGDLDKYRRVTDRLEASLIALMGNGRLGGVFSQQTSDELDITRPAGFDISSIDPANTSLVAAALMACWNAGYSLVYVAQALADAHLEPQRHFAIVIDEMWRAIRAAAGIVDRIDGLTRLDRNEGVCQFQITHSLADLNALPEIDRLKARGFAERAGLVIAGGLSGTEMPALNEVVGLSRAEQKLLTGWGTPSGWNSHGRDVPPPGRGNFLVKVKGRPGIPFHLELTPREIQLFSTNTRWEQWANRGRATA